MKLEHISSYKGTLVKGFRSFKINYSFNKFFVFLYVIICHPEENVLYAVLRFAE